MMFSLPTFISALLAAAAAVSASPIAAREELIVFSPHITAPTAGVVFTVGSAQQVKWDASNIPAEKQNATGLLLLGHQQNGSENLNITHPLASGFPLNTGIVSITVPQVPTADDYIVVLFGDSGNVSPQFTITAA